jgi:hypothetical protein
MQPNPKPGFSDENNRHELLLTWIIMWLPTWMLMWLPTWMTHGSLRGRHVASYVDDDVATNIDVDFSVMGH